MPESTELSERELEILKLVATGASNKEIAHDLYISANTVKVHLRRIFNKIGAASRTEAAMYAVQAGLVPTSAVIAEEIEDSDGSDGESKLDDAFGPASPPAGSAFRTLRIWFWIPLVVVFVGALVLGIRALLLPSAPEPGGLLVPTDLPRWQVRAGLPQPRQGIAAAAYENRIYAIGGETTAEVVSAVQRYELNANTWQELASKPTPVTDIRAAVIGGKIYIPGGRGVDGKPTNVLEVYDPRENLWRQAQPLPRALSAGAVAAFEGKLYLFGGWDGKAYSREVYQYDPGLDVWESRTPMPTARAFAGAATSGDRIFVIGGEDDSGALAVNEIYLPVLDGSGDSPWLYGAALPEGRSGSGVVSFSDFIYVIGGRGLDERSLPSLQYFSQQESWQSFDAPFSVAWSNFGIAAAGSQLYVLGGRAGDQVLSNLMVYQAVYTVSIPFLSGEQ